VKLWLDDLRPAPEGWEWVKTVSEAKLYLINRKVTHASLDNDLGEGVQEGRKLVLWMAEKDIWPTESCVPHSANPVAHKYMSEMIARYGPYTKEQK
jgi:hypothetical protein